MKSKHPGGRPTKFKEDYIRQAYIACKEGGFTNLKLAKLFNVQTSTIGLWKKENKKFSDAINKGKDEWDCLSAEKCLLKRVTGYRFTEKTKETDDTGKLKLNKTVSKHVPPDVKACEIWLCNRNPKRWRKLKHVELTGADGDPLIVQVVKFSEKDAENTNSK